jgi:hypothetical protein
MFPKPESKAKIKKSAGHFKIILGCPVFVFVKIFLNLPQKKRIMSKYFNPYTDFGFSKAFLLRTSLMLPDFLLTKSKIYKSLP